MKTGNKNIKSFRLWMIAAFLAVFALTAVISSTFYTEHLKRQTNRTLTNAINDTEDAIDLGVRDFLLRLTYDVAYTDIGDSLVCITNINEQTVKAHDEDGRFTSSDVDIYLKEYADALKYKEINVIDKNGIIIYTNVDEYYGYDMAEDSFANEQAHDFFENIVKDGYYVQESRGTSYNINNRIKYAGIRLDKDCYLCSAGSYLQVGFDLTTIQDNINYQVPMSAANHRVGESGMIIICPDRKTGDEYVPVGMTGVGTHGSNLTEALGGESFNFDPDSYGHNIMCTGVLYGIPCHFMYRERNSYYIIAAIPLSEAHAARNTTIIYMVLMEFCSFLLLYVIMFLFTMRFFGEHKKFIDRLNKHDV